MIYYDILQQCLNFILIIDQPQYTQIIAKQPLACFQQLSHTIHFCSISCLLKLKNIVIIMIIPLPHRRFFPQLFQSNEASSAKSQQCRKQVTCVNVIRTRLSMYSTAELLINPLTITEKSISIVQVYKLIHKFMFNQNFKQLIPNMQDQPLLPLRKRLQNFLINRDLLPLHLQNISLIAELVLYISVINGSTFPTTLFRQYIGNNLYLLLIIAILLLVRWVYSVSVVSFFYIFIINGIFESQITNYSGIILLLLGFLIAIDIVSKISFDSRRQDVSAQKLNWVKILHYLFLIFGITLAKKYSQSHMIHLALIGAFCSITLLKKNSLMINNNYKQLLIRSYIWISLQHLKILLMAWINTSVPLIQLVGPLIISQAVYEIYKRIKLQITLDELYIAEDYLSISVQILRYIHAHSYNQQMEHRIDSIIENQSSLSYQDKRKLYVQKTIIMLNKKKSFYSQILLAGMYVSETGQILRSQQIVNDLRDNCKCYQLIHRVLIHRVQQRINQKYRNQKSKIRFPYFNQYRKSEQIKELMLKSSIKHIQFHEYKQKVEVEASQLKRRTLKLANLQKQLHKNYNSFDIKCISISMFYISYLLQVARDQKTAYLILESLNFQKQPEIDLDLDEKIFIRLSLLPELLSIQKIGQNVHNLIGYSRKELKNQKINILLPQFYRNHHRRRVEQTINTTLVESYMFKKKTLVKNNFGFYRQCDLLLSLNHNLEGELSLAGYLHVRNNNAYDFQRFLFIRQNGDILECSNDLKQFSPTLDRTHNFQEYFVGSDQVNRIQIHKQKRDYLQYHPLILMTTEQEPVYFFAQAHHANSSDVSFLTYGVSNHTIKTQSMVQKQMSSINPVEYSEQVIVKYAKRMNQIIRCFYDKTFLALIVVIFILLLGVFLSEYYLVQGIKAKTDHLNLITKTFSNIINYYNYTYKIAIDMSYLDLNIQYNYTNNYTSLNILEESLSIQDANQYLKMFNGINHPVPSMNPAIVYQKTNYDLILQLASNSYLTYQFQNDPFVFQKAIARTRLNMQTIMITSILDYRKGFLSYISPFSQQDHQINNISLIFFFVLTFLLFPAIVKFQSQFRTNNDNVMQLIYTIHPTEKQVQGIKNFIRKLTTEKIDFKSPEFLVLQKNQQILAQQRGQPNSKLSLRQVSGRNFMEDSLNRSQLNVQEPNIKMTQDLFITPRNLRTIPQFKWMLLVPFLIILIMWTLAVINQLLNNTYKDIDELQSTERIVNLTKISSNFSRAIINVLNLICLKSSGVVSFSNTAFNSYLNSYMASTADPVVPTFVQTAFPEFAPFKTALDQFNNNPICTFMNCTPQYQQQINLFHYATIQQISSFLPTIQSALNNITNNTLGSNLLFLNHYKPQIDLMFYSENLLRNWVFKLYALYPICFSVFNSNLRSSKMGFVCSIIALTGILCIFFCLLLAYVIQEHRKLEKICRLIKTDENMSADEQA